MKLMKNIHKHVFFTRYCSVSASHLAFKEFVFFHYIDFLGNQFA